MRRIRRSGPRYGYDARIRNTERARRDAALTKRTRTILLSWLTILAAVAVFIVGWDHVRGPMDLPRPVEATDVTATPAPHPKVMAR
jgi:hypothetical protein